MNEILQAQNTYRALFNQYLLQCLTDYILLPSKTKARFKKTNKGRGLSNKVIAYNPEQDTRFIAKQELLDSILSLDEKVPVCIRERCEPKVI